MIKGTNMELNCRQGGIRNTWDSEDTSITAVFSALIHHRIAKDSFASTCKESS